MQHKYFLRLIFLLCVFTPVVVLAQPANDACVNAIQVPIPQNGFGFGTIVVDTVQINAATTQFGEYFAPGVPNGKSVWYKFSLPTTRKVRILLTQNGLTMSANQAGWTLYNSDACFPGVNEVMDPPIFNIEGFTHACLREGDYLLQVGADLVANGELIVTFEVGASSAVETEYDFAKNAYDFGIISTLTNTVSFEVGCQSVFEGENICPDSSFTKSTWHVFTTDNLVDILGIHPRESPFNNANTTPREFGYNLYLGDIRTDSTNLILVDSCKTLQQTSNGNYDRVGYACELMPNTTYSVQLLYPTDYFGNMRVDILENGSAQTLGPDPVTLPASHQFGILAATGVTSVTDVMSCNAKMTQYACGTNIPDTVMYGTTAYDLNYWVTFEVPIEQNMRIYLTPNGGQPTARWRVFQGDASVDCNLPLYGEGNYGQDFPCMPPGIYSVQVLGASNVAYGPGTGTSLGKTSTLEVEVLQKNINQFGLATPTNFEAINGGAALAPASNYVTTQNYFDCQTTIMPAGDSCSAINDRAMYRVFTVGQDGYVRISGGNYNYFQYKLFAGNATTAPVVNGTITGMTDLTCCHSLYFYSPLKVCVTPGDYTLVTYGDSTDVNISDNPTIRFDTIPPPPFTSPATAEILDTLSLINTPVSSTPVYVPCTDNPLTILGYAPCGNATKQVYREFYLADTASVTFQHNLLATAYSDGSILHRMFRGRISTNSLTGLERDCFSSFYMSSCEFMEPGWYTVVTYSDGDTYTDPEYCAPDRGKSIGNQTGFTLTVNPAYQPPLFNTFAKAEQVNGGVPLSWSPQFAAGHTDTIPKYDTTYVLGTEYFNCENDLPLPAGIVSCNPAYERVSYRVFTLDKPSMVKIYNLDSYYYYNNVGQSRTRLYSGNVPATAAPYTIVEDCFVDDLHTCLPAGTYTLVTFFADWYIGQSVTPSIYVDSLGTSKFNHANNAYDFGNIPLNGTEYLAAPGTPLDALGRPASNDFFFCSTDAYATEPNDVCGVGTQTIPYTSHLTNPRQTLWYTFEVSGPGSVDVSVYGLTPGKHDNMAFAIYKVANNVVPLTDSTNTDLTFITSNRINNYCYSYAQTANVFRDPCAAATTDRYVVIVDQLSQQYNGQTSWPNQQIQVGVQFGTIPGTTVQYNHYSQANVISGNPSALCSGAYPDTTFLSGTFTGCEGNLTCATQDVTDQNTCGAKTIWYKFKVGSSGLMRVNHTRTDNGTTTFNPNDLKLFREVIPGDSTTSGLVPVPLSQTYLSTNPDFPGTYYWGETCYTEGTYYLMFTGCNFPNATVVPRVWLENYPGDFCYDSIAVQIPAPGTYQATGVVNCWTIGEAPGENLPSLDCAGTPLGKKTGWFYINITDTAKMDLNITLTENTTATSLDVQYRVANGSCNLMTFENCVDDVFITLNLKCRRDSGLWIQVILPENSMGDVTMNVEATISPDQSCEPPNPFEPSANFDFLTGCEGDPVKFLNQSSQGAGLSYLWDFGDGFSSTFINPDHVYAIADTYLVQLIVMYDSLADTTSRQVVVFPDPVALFASVDTVLAGTPLTITNNSTNLAPYTTFYWTFCGPGFCSADYLNYSGSMPPPVTYDIPGEYEICLTVTNGNCVGNFCKTIVVRTPNYYSGGPYDGVDHLKDDSQCELPIFVTGGPYDGFDAARDDNNCEIINFVYGGPYDGADEEKIICENDTAQSIWSGGSQDGASSAMIFLNCELPTSIWAGGSMTYSGNAAIFNECAVLPFFAGGPYDGQDRTNTIDECTTPPFFAGGPYDGADVDHDECEVIPFFAGGPYDGTEKEQVSSSGLFINDISVCIGEDATLTTAGPTNWYLTPGGQTQAFSVDSFTIYNNSSTLLVYADDACASSTQSAAIHVQDTFSLDFAFTSACGTNPALFVNQGLIPGSSLPTIGTSITSSATQGSTPGFNQLSTSQGNIGNFASLTDGNVNTTAWGANNAAAGTVWLQWKYFTARSVDRISFANHPSFLDKRPTQARLYYSTGGPWILVKVFSSAQLQNIQFDSGPFCESRNKYGQLWKLELDVDAANAPYLTELQVYANELTTSAPTVWDYGDGSPLDTTSNPIHVYNAPGNYSVSMWLPDDCSCDQPAQKELEITPCSILSLLDHELSGYINEGDNIDLTWEVHGEFEEAYLEKYLDREWTEMASWAPRNSIWYQYEDKNPIAARPNLYRVRVENQGQVTYSNNIEITYEIQQVKMTLFPNPVSVGSVSLDISLPDPAEVEILVWNHLGQFVGKVYGERLEEGKQTLSLPVERLAEGSYYLRVFINQQPYIVRMLVL